MTLRMTQPTTVQQLREPAAKRSWLRASLLALLPLGVVVTSLAPFTVAVAGVRLHQPLEIDAHGGWARGTLSSTRLDEGSSLSCRMHTNGSMQCGASGTVQTSAGEVQERSAKCFATGFDKQRVLWGLRENSGLYFERDASQDCPVVVVTQSSAQIPARPESLPGCGNGIVDDGEVCDDGSVLDGYCAPDCNSEPGYCGDGIVQPGAGEFCDGTTGCNLPSDELPGCTGYTFTHVYDTVLEPACSGCHSAGDTDFGGTFVLDRTTDADPLEQAHRSLMTATTTCSSTGSASYITAGDPDASYLYRKVTLPAAVAPVGGDVCGERMPLGGELTADEQEILYWWIKAGAHND